MKEYTLPEAMKISLACGATFCRCDGAGGWIRYEKGFTYKLTFQDITAMFKPAHESSSRKVREWERTHGSDNRS